MIKALLCVTGYSSTNHIAQTFKIGLFQSQECDIFDRKRLQQTTPTTRNNHGIRDKDPDDGDTCSDKPSLGPNVYTRNSGAAETSWDNAFTGVLCLRDGGSSSLEGTAYWGVVHFYCNDCLLGFPYIVGNVLGARNRKVPCHPLADDRVRLLCALVLLLLYSSSCFCSEGRTCLPGGWCSFWVCMLSGVRC